MEAYLVLIKPDTYPVNFLHQLQQDSSLIFLLMGLFQVKERHIQLWLAEHSSVQNSNKWLNLVPLLVTRAV